MVGAILGSEMEGWIGRDWGRSLMEIVVFRDRAQFTLFEAWMKWKH